MKWISALAVILFCLSFAFGQKMTDREFAGLKGKIKLVEQTEEKLSPKAEKEEKDRDSEFNEAGGLVKESVYLFGSRTIYFTLDGSKVSRSEEFAESKFKLEPLFSISGTESEKANDKPKLSKEMSKADPRYEVRYEYKYDSAGRIIREIQYTNRGERDDDTEYSYDKHGHMSSETRKSPDNGKWKYSYRYDSKGLLLEEISIYIHQNGERQFTLSYKYSDYKLDEKGNWIERKESQKHADDPNEVPKVTLQRRHLTYF